MGACGVLGLVGAACFFMIGEAQMEAHPIFYTLLGIVSAPLSVMGFMVVWDTA